MSAAIAAAVAVAVGTGVSIYQQGKAADAEKEQREVQNRVNERRNAKERMEAIARARVAAAQVQNAAAIGGFSGDTSGSAGSASSIGSQVAFQANFIDQNTTDMRRAVSLADDITKYNQNANYGQGLAALGQLGLQAKAAGVGTNTGSDDSGGGGGGRSGGGGGGDG